MIGVILFNYLFGLLVHRFRERNSIVKAILICAIVVNIGILGYYKYAGFVIENINHLLGTQITYDSIGLPLGISFFIFQALSYVIDIYRGKGQVQKNPLNVGLYISFFPQLIAGPIVRYETVAKQIKDRTETFQQFSQGVTKFIIGLGKKVIIANNIGMVADTAFSLVGDGQYQASFAMAWLGAITYMLQIYFDFSGYSDMAIGLGKMFGFQFNKNFNYPYMAKSVSEFWQRWHISMQTWFRDYVYFPLGGSHVSTKSRLVFNLLVVWLLTGIWHGANWTFIVWGLLYFVILTLEKLTKFHEKIGPLKRVYTLLIVLMGWVVFRADSVADAMTYLGAMLNIHTTGFVDAGAVQFMKQNIWFYLVAILASTPIIKNVDKHFSNRKVWNGIYTVMLVAILLLSVSYIFSSSYNPFIYFNF
ncbi:MAG: MBOAT family O-acyltransferase [Eubacteriales bacterium]